MLHLMAQGFALLALALAGVQVVSIALAFAHLNRPRARSTAAPVPITLIRPVCGRDPKDEATLGSSFTQDYPDYDLIFCVADAADPVVPLVHDLIAAHPHVPARLLVGDDRISANPKLNNVMKGWAAARSDWIVMADSNLLLPRDYLTQLWAEFRPGVGMVSSPAVGTEPETAAAHLECAYLNTHQARWQLMADQLGMGYAQGKTLFYHRPLIQAAGGLAILGQDLAEDVASTKVTRAAGLVVRLPAAPFAQPVGRRSWAAVWQRQVRWARIRRHGFPALYAAEVLNGALPFAIFAVLGGIGADLILAALVLWYAAEWLLAQKGDWPRGYLDVGLWILRDLMNPWLWVQGWRGASFEWRGNVMSSTDPGSR